MIRAYIYRSLIVISLKDRYTNFFVNKVQNVNRVLYDVTSKLPSTIRYYDEAFFCSHDLWMEGSFCDNNLLIRKIVIIFIVYSYKYT
ncbi:hypothetical protein [Exiguobacterium sp. s133]|uniref:GMP synthase (glutamine-hydrolyzing) n=1 Tax=Exiguobacterium sp. s133 TaxID=2751213 RepID=UPI001BECB388